MKEIMKKLRKPFHPDDIEWRMQSSGLKKDDTPWVLVLAYVSARAVQDRLDEIFGVLGWQTDYTESQNGMLCHLKVWDETQWIIKTDGAPQTEFEPFKGGISGALKRAASAGLGIGRYLYDLEATFGIMNVKGKYKGIVKDKETKKILARFRWDPPELPKWALPDSFKKKASESPVKPQKEEVEQSQEETEETAPTSQDMAKSNDSMTEDELIKHCLSFMDDKIDPKRWNDLHKEFLGGKMLSSVGKKGLLKFAERLKLEMQPINQPDESDEPWENEH